MGVFSIGFDARLAFASSWREFACLVSKLTYPQRTTRADAALTLLEQAVSQQRAGLLTYAADVGPVPVQLMGLYQTKGREADATVVVLRSNDFYGTENAPFPVGSRLLYVVLTRARHKTLLLLFGNHLPALVAPLANLASG